MPHGRSTLSHAEIEPIAKQNQSLCPKSYARDGTAHATPTVAQSTHPVRQSSVNSDERSQGNPYPSHGVAILPPPSSWVDRGLRKLS